MSTLLIGGCGYIGSALYGELSKTRTVKCVDIERRGNPGNVPHLNLDYADMSYALVQLYDDIILLAGHSSVGECKSDPSGAFYNNVVAFQRLLERMDKRQRLIYASSSSIYSGFGATAASEATDDHANMYDLSKYIDDALATLSGRRCYGLRFGTVNGPSPNLRRDVMLNKMTDSAINDGFVQIANPKIHRPILGINDLARAVISILDGDGAPGIYNLSSFNDTVAHLGAVVADQLNVPLILGEPSVAYDFTISSSKFERAYNFTFNETAESIVESLVRSHGSNGRSDDAVHTVETLSGV